MTLHCNLNFKSADQILPPKSGKYICLTCGGGYNWSKLEYSARWNRFNASDDQDTCKYAIKVDWWAEPPAFIHF